jgi:hypothetical protein
MAGARKRPSEEGMVGRLAGRGEEALTRVIDELGKNERVTDALGRAMAAKGKVDETTRKTLGQIGLSPSADVKELGKRLDRLEKRIQKLEGGSRATSSSGARKTGATSTRKRTPPRRTS